MMKNKQILTTIIVIAAGAYLIKKVLPSLEALTEDPVSLFGFVFLIGLIALAIVRILRS